MKHSSIKAFTLILITCLIAGCGFHLRGQNFISPKIRAVYLQANDPYSSFTNTLKETLRSLGIKLVDSPDEAPITLKIYHTGFAAQGGATIGSSTTARVITFNYTVLFALLDPKGNRLLPPQGITSSGKLNLNPNQLITTNNEVDQLKSNLQRDAISQMVNILGSEQVTQMADKLK